MAVLTETERAQIWRGIMRWWSAPDTQADISITKAQLRAAIDASDDWIDTNAVSFNNSLPAAAKSGLSATQKTLLFCAVALMRVNMTLAKQIFGEVD